MQLAAFAFDYDGTLAREGRAEDSTVDALRRLKAAGCRLLLVSGRELPDLQQVFPRYDVFDGIVVENGAVLFLPSLHEERCLAPPPPPQLLGALRRRKVRPLSVGRSIIATWQPNHGRVLEAIRECGLEWQIIFNKGAVMCLPPGTNKASGLLAALEAFELSPLNVLGVGDAENDTAMLAACGHRAAVANALDVVKAEADFVTKADHGAGVAELIERFLADPPEGLTRSVRRHDLHFGRDADGRAIAIPPHAAVLITGASGGGKSRLAALLIERILEHGFQLCIVDPEGEHERLGQLSVLGDPQSPPSLEEAHKLLLRPANNVVLNLLAVEHEARPTYLSRLAAQLEALRVQSARPHWLIIDEAHHVIPPDSQPRLLSEPRKLPGTILITAAAHSLPRHVLEAMQVVLTVGDQAEQALEHYCEALGVRAPQLSARTAARGEALYWDRATARAQRVIVDEPKQAHQRHVRKYAEGTLGPDRSFLFRGPNGALKLRAENLTRFLQLAEGIDDETWLYHLKRGDYSRWFRDVIVDQALAQRTADIEQQLGSDPRASREAISELVNQRYTAPADTWPA
jgi:hydroxymethylpyrimidine pyrophosphatase-like HAD family hydrolase